MLSMTGMGVSIVYGFLAEVGDLKNYAYPKQIQKLAGLNLKENSSGKHKWQTRITKMGRSKLRALLFRATMPMVSKNPEFRNLHKHYTTRVNNTLKKTGPYMFKADQNIVIIRKERRHIQPKEAVRGYEYYKS